MSKPKPPYGGRWKIVRSLATGGQSEVFVVEDLDREHEGELVLKRVLNPKRNDRFRNEINATKLLNHPNIIRLIDHSALNDDQNLPDKQYLIMPLAAHGDLSKRVILYKNNVDSVVMVAQQLASALKAAHDSGIVHRDVKPQNILFPTAGHDIWLCDFGICLIRNQDRSTEVSEVVGPTQFIAPELEGGGVLEVAAAADIYSLGKVIYYMLSGGVVIPRERMHDSEYSALFDLGGERQRRLQVLLSKMICPLQTRLQTMDEVLGEIARIESWAVDARLLPVNPSTLTGIEALQRNALSAQRIAAENDDARARRNEAVRLARVGILGWISGELEKTAALIGQQGGLTSGVRSLDDPKDVPALRANQDAYHPGSAVELWVNNPHDPFHPEHILRFSFCTKFVFRIVHGSQNRPTESEHADVAVLPTYTRGPKWGTAQRKVTWQLLTATGQTAPFPSTQPNPGLTGRMYRQPNMVPPPLQVQLLTFSTDQWPQVIEPFANELKRALDAFIGLISASASGRF